MPVCPVPIRWPLTCHVEVDVTCARVLRCHQQRGQQRLDYVNKWLIDHELELNNSLGVEDSPEVKFLTGILIVTSTSKAQAPFLQDVIEADAAHMSFGKYTLFSAYAGSANTKMVGLGFAILFHEAGEEGACELGKEAEAIYRQLSEEASKGYSKGQSVDVSPALAASSIQW